METSTLPKSVLIVEDEALIAMDLAAILVGFGYSIAGTAASGEDALQLADSLQPDLVLMDITLRGQLDGVETARLLKQRHRVPLVFISAYSDGDVLRRASEIGPQGFVIKPFAEGHLKRVVKSALSAA